jgi:hypothetical protein
MPRPKQPLLPKYGKLTVIRELPCSAVEVRCECGFVKSVARSNLRAGRVVSCGARTCRTLLGADGKPLAGRPLGPRWIELDKVPELYHRYTAGGVTAAVLGAEHGVPQQTIYSLMSRIDAAGGIGPYMAAAVQNASTRVNRTSKVKPAPAVVTGPVTPPSTYTPVTRVPRPPTAYTPPVRLLGTPYPGFAQRANPPTPRT